ncbi:MAG: zinc-dependent metalloprotease [Longimicrobiales bacterium]|nr:zinc-dependent metalloprotease [Longimicrobiales bacterium]
MSGTTEVTRGWTLALLLAAAACGGASQAATPPSPQGAARLAGATARQDTGPKPYREIVTDRAVSDSGLFAVHRVDDKLLFEIPDSLLEADMLLISRIAGVPAAMGGFLSAGMSVNEQMVRWERQGNQVLLRKYATQAVAADSLPIYTSVADNNFAPVLASFPIQAFGADSATLVVDVTDFYKGDTPAISGLTPAQRRNYQVRRLDPARSYLNWARSFPLNVNVRHTQTYDAGLPPSDAETSTISMEMNQSLVLLPRNPMMPRHADPRVGYFTLSQINYGLDEQKAATQTFIRRWRLEPKDPMAYARGEVVEPVLPIVYYVDPATPERFRAAVKRGVENWQPVFETAGFRNAIVARYAPTPEEDPEWDPEDVRYSVVRWTASLTRNAMGPSTSDPRTGEIIESDIVWYHNHLRSYRNWLMVQTGASNPGARTLPISDELMDEAMEQVITHEIGHALGLPHNMLASSSYPVDSLRSADFSRRMGVAPTIMDYARQNYVAQPGDGLQPLDFLRHVGPYDHYVINWGYRVIPGVETPDDEAGALDRWVLARAGDPMYRYLPQGGPGAADPRAQTEDMGDDPVRANTYGMDNLRRVVPRLVEWTTKPGEDYTELEELHGEAIGQWQRYVGHVVGIVGGVYADLKTADQDGAVYRGVPRARQKEAMAWIGREVFEAPVWLADREILSRIGTAAAGLEALSSRQAGVLSQLLDARRMGRLAETETTQPEDAYPLLEFLDDVRAGVWQDLSSVTAVDGHRRALQRAYLERVQDLMTEQPASNAFQGRAPDLTRSDARPLLRAQLVDLRQDAERASRRIRDRVTRAHLLDVLERIDAILEGDVPAPPPPTPPAGGGGAPVGT